MHLIGVIVAAAAAAPAPGSSIPSTDTVTVEARRVLPSVGLMNDHMHEAGEFMIGIRFQHFDWGGANRHGTSRLSDAELLAAGYMMRAKSMTMDMAMLDLMYGLTENLTVTLSPQYVWNRMTMVGIDPMGGMDGGMTFGDTARESFHGIGDTLASASLRLARTKYLNAHVTLGVWAPSGRAGFKNPDGTFTEYDMQTGSGTWDIEPSGTLTGDAGPLGWGVQGGYRFRAQRRNGAGYRLGNRALLTGWLSYHLGSSVSVTARAEFTHQGRIHGEYDGPASMGMPEDVPANYGGDLLIGAVGVNWKPSLPMQRGPQLGIELGVPLYQRHYGVQLPQRWQLSAGVRDFF
jgi:hypothetical protein